LLLKPAWARLSSRPDQGKLSEFSGIAEQNMGDLLKEGWCDARTPKTVNDRWPKFRRVFYGLLLGVEEGGEEREGSANHLARIREQKRPDGKPTLAFLYEECKSTEKEWARKLGVVERMADYFFGESDDGGYFKEEVMYSPAPCRPSEAAYEILSVAALADQTSRGGEIFLVSGGSTFAQAEDSLLAMATVAAAGVGITCHFCCPQHSVVRTPAWDSTEAFFKQVNDSFVGDHSLFDLLWGIKKARFTEERAVESGLSPETSLAKEIKSRISRVEIPLQKTLKEIRRTRRWPGQFLNPAFRYVSIAHPDRTGQDHVRFFVSRVPSSETAENAGARWHPLRHPFSFKGSPEELVAFGKWLEDARGDKSCEEVSLQHWQPAT
jgi:hypothetical protein